VNLRRGLIRLWIVGSGILLLGLLPRDESSSALLRVAVAQVNQLIRDCADGQHIFPKSARCCSTEMDARPRRIRLTSCIIARGYALLVERLDTELDRLLGPSR
jgi:hypothetical protein